MQLFGGSPKKDDKYSLLRDPDRYKMMGFLGKGRTADISTAFDSRLGRIVALKQLRQQQEDNPESGSAFLTETKLISYLDHPGVVSIYDSFILDEDNPCYTMKLIAGNNLAWDLSTKTRGQLLSVFIKLCETLAFVHDKGVVHLDLNPENIMLGEYGEVFINDWGNARIFDPRPYHEYMKLVKDAPPPPDDAFAQSSSHTPLYMSPEQTSGDRTALTPSSDVFSMGIILYQMMTGRLPFYSEDLTILAQQICQLNPPAMHEVSPEIPWNLSQICSKMLAKDPFDRYHSFHEVLIDIDKFQNSGQAFAMRTFATGDILIREGDPGDYAFTILSGSVEVSRMIDGEKKVLATLGKDETIGELAIFTRETRTATCTALEPNTVIRIMDRASVEKELQKLSPWVENMITGLSRRFMDLSDTLAKQ